MRRKCRLNRARLKKFIRAPARRQSAIEIDAVADADDGLAIQRRVIGEYVH
jgi:hypothetical protein